MANKRKNLYVGLFIIFLMVSSTLGFIVGNFSDDENADVSVGDRGFNYVNGFWVLNNGGYSYRFRNLPEQGYDYGAINLENDVFLFSEGISEEQLARLSYFFATNSVKYSLLDNLNCSSSKQVLVLKGGLDKIYKDGDCLVFEGGLDKSIDRIGFSLVL